MSSLRGGIMMPARTTSPTRLKRARTAMDASGYTARPSPMGGPAAPPMQGGAQGPSQQRPPMQGGMQQGGAVRGGVMRQGGGAGMNGVNAPRQFPQGPPPQAPVQTSVPGQAGRPRTMTPHTAADAQAANPLRYTGDGLARTRGVPDIRPKVIGEGPPVGFAGAQRDVGTPPNQTPASAVQPTNRFGLQAPAVWNQQQNPGGTPSENMGPQYDDGNMSNGYWENGVWIPNAGLNDTSGSGQYRDPATGGMVVGSSQSGLLPNDDDFEIGQTASGDLATGGNSTVVTSNVATEDGTQNVRGLDNKGIEGSPGPGGGQSLDDYLNSLGPVPELDRGKLEDQIRAEDQRQALEESRVLQASAESGSRAGVDAGQAIGMQGEIAHRGAAERQVRGANMRMEQERQNFSAQVQAYAQRHQAALQAAQLADNEQARQHALKTAREMLERQTQAQEQLMQLDWELSKKMSWQDWLGLGISYHQSNAQGAQDAFGSFLGGGGAAMFCDRRVKKRIEQDGAAMLRALDQLVAYSYEYDLEEVDEEAGKHFGVMAQDLLQSTAGKTLVKTGPEGHLQIDNRKAIPFLLGCCALLKREIDTLREYTHG